VTTNLVKSIIINNKRRIRNHLKILLELRVGGVRQEPSFPKWDSNVAVEVRVGKDIVPFFGDFHHVGTDEDASTEADGGEEEER
jgi:hypothetical protein